MSKGIFGGLFDLNHDGKMNAAERALEFAILEDILSEEEEDDDTSFDDFDYNDD